MEVKFKDQAEYEFMWRHNGLHPATGQQLTIMDAISTPDASPWLPQVISNQVKEAAEPLLVGTRLLQRIEFHYGQTITFPAVGALEASDIAEGQAYPEQRLQMGGATVTANIGKSGVAVKITEEMIRYSQFDVIGMHLRKAGQALARWKEKKIFNFIHSMGAVCFDNKNPGSSFFGVTHGRAQDGSANGTAIMDDLFDAYAQVMLQGFMPNTFLMHPLAWAAFVKDPVMRAMMLAGASNTWYGTWSGSPAGRAPWDSSSHGGKSVSGGQSITPAGGLSGDAPSGASPSPLSAYSQTINSAPNLPGYFPFPITIIVSPFAHFDPATRLTDIVVFDSNELGALIVDEDITTDEWNDQSVDIRKIKLRERYGLAIFNEGLAIGLLKNIKVAPNEIVLPAQASISVSGSLAAIPAGTAVV